MGGAVTRREPTGAPTAERVARGLSDQMLTGRLRPGTPLRDTALAEQFEVSRNTVREAFRLLQAQGLTTYQRNKGTVVRRLDAPDINDIYIVRRALELRAVDQSGLASAEALRALDDTVAAAAAVYAAEQWQELGTASLEFHSQVVALLASPSLNGFFASMLSRLRLAFATMPDEADFQAPWLARDAEINDLIQAGEVNRASQALRLYLEDSEIQLLAALRRGPRP